MLGKKKMKSQIKHSSVCRIEKKKDLTCLTIEISTPNSLNKISLKLSSEDLITFNIEGITWAIYGTDLIPKALKIMVTALTTSEWCLAKVGSLIIFINVAMATDG